MSDYFENSIEVEFPFTPTIEVECQQLVPGVGGEYMCVIVNGKIVRKFNTMSDDYAYTNAYDYADKLRADPELCNSLLSDS